MNESSSPTPQFTWRMLVLYFVLAFALTWAVLIPMVRWVAADQQMPWIILAAFGPMLAAVITIWVSQGQAALRRWLRQVFRLGAPLVSYLSGAFLMPVGVGLAHYGLYRALGGDPGLSDAAPWFLYLVYLLPTALLTGGNEEPGWRGFALPALLERVHPLIASLILGLAHAAWHLPPMEHYGTTFGRYLFGLIPLTVLLNWLYLTSRKSVWPVMLLHAGTNVIGTFLPTPSDVLGGLGDFVLLRGIVYWAIALVLTVATRGRLGWTEPLVERPTAARPAARRIRRVSPR